MKIKQVLIAIDQLANALLGGWADETLSSRAWRRKKHWAVAIIDTLFFWERDHCYQSYRSEHARRQLPPEFRSPCNPDQHNQASQTSKGGRA